MFGRSGFDATRVDAIAEVAGVSVGTVYNHFPTKTDILVAILLRDVRLVVREAQGIVDDPGPSPAQAVQRALRVLLERMERRPRALWRQVFGQGYIDADGLGAAFIRTLQLFRALLGAIFARQRAQGALPSRFNPDEAAALAFALAYALVSTYVRDDRIGARATTNAMLRQCELVFAVHD